ncbi:MAG: BMP family ABC transporter substrate-binding protein [Clostridiales bacterium]|nr:BMP family ABC transporter substrate-binding protein [Clostridiales bacterium]
MKKKLGKMLTLLMVVTMLLTMTTAGLAEGPLKVALVLAGGLGDRSFYDSSNAGIERAGAELGIEYKVLECRNDPSAIKDQMVEASEYAQIVVAVGFEFGDIIQALAADYPEVDYIYVDNAIPDIENLITVSYADNEGAFLAGALAAMMTTSTELEGMNEEKIIGMVGGEDIEVIRNFQVGYEAGAKYIDEEVEVKVLFAQTFEDPAKGKENATSLYSAGADIVFQVAGKTGEGVFLAAKEQGKYAIGVDTDQRYIEPDHIIASMKKEVGTSIYDTIVQIQEGTVERGKVITYGLAQQGVGLSYGDETMPELVPATVVEQLEKIREEILSGTIEVPTVK